MPCPDTKGSGFATVETDTRVLWMLALGPVLRSNVYAFITRPVAGLIIGLGIPRGSDSPATKSKNPQMCADAVKGAIQHPTYVGILKKQYRFPGGDRM